MPLDRQGIAILSRGCVCGHDHKTRRGEDVELCLDCSCDEHIPRCQNCGEEAGWAATTRQYDACSDRCLRQIQYAETLKAGSL